MFTTFAYTLAGGMLAVLATGRQKDLSYRFVRVVGLIVFALACFATAWDVRALGTRAFTPGAPVGLCGVLLAAGALVVVLMAPTEKRCSRVFASICGLGGLAGVIAGGASVIAMAGDRLTSGLAIGMVAAGQVTGAILLGSITIAWLLGHAYLTATRMTITPLHHFTRLLAWAVALRALFVLVSVATAWLVGRDGAQPIFADLLNAWFVVSLRVAMGLVAVGVFAYMVADCVRLRSTQSATGILYFASIFAYVGELASQQLIAECGWAL